MVKYLLLLCLLMVATLYTLGGRTDAPLRDGLAGKLPPLVSAAPEKSVTRPADLAAVRQEPAPSLPKAAPAPASAAAVARIQPKPAGSSAVVTAGEQLSFWDKAFEAQMDLGVINTQKAYEAMRYRDVAKYGYYDWLAARDTYRDCCVKVGCPMNARLVRRFIEQGALIISPVLTFFAEHVWCSMLGHQGSIKHARWPEVSAPDMSLVRAAAFIHSTVRFARLKVIDDAKKRLKKGDKSKATSITIGVSNEYPEYHQRVLRFLADKAQGMAFPDDIMAQAQKFCTDDAVCKPNMSKALKHVANAVARIADEQSLEALELHVPFDQCAILEAQRDFVTKAIELDAFRIVLATAETDTAIPGLPQYSVP